MTLVNPKDSIERQNEKLLVIARALMRRVEQNNEQSGLAYQQFERAALLETEVRERTQDLERALDLLQESNARLEIANSERETAQSNLTEAIETINDGFALFGADGGLILSNSRFCRDLADVVAFLKPGLPFEDYIHLISRSHYLAIPEGISAQDWASQRLNRHGENHVVFNVGLKWDRWLQISEHRTSRGGTVILQTDVTSIIRRERRERDRMRDHQAEMLQATLDHLNQGVCIFDETNTLVGWNSRMDSLMAFAPDQVSLGGNFDDLLAQLEDELEFDAHVNADYLREWTHRGKFRAPLAFEVTRGAGQTLSVFAQEMPDHGFVISFTDVTAERAAARTLSDMNEILEQRVQDRTHELGVALAEAERANASKTRFVAAASHDLLQPLSAAKLFLSSLSEETQTEAGRDVLAKADTALKSVEQFISALLDISKLDAGKAVFEVVPLRLTKIFTPLRDELMPIAAQKGIELRIVDCSLSILSDPGYMRRIVQNLLINAIRYTDQGRVLMGVRRFGGHARIEVWDTGRGIAAADQLTIFKEFERISPNHSDKGLGLGLSIVERACKGLDHELTLRSTPGQGSCFGVTVPIHRESEITHHAPLPKEHNLSGKLLMLVDQNSRRIEQITRIIEERGATVIQAETRAEALSILDEIQLVPDGLLIAARLDQNTGGLKLYQEFHNRYGFVPSALFAGVVHQDLRQACAACHVDLIEIPAHEVLNKKIFQSFFERI